jgi:hypothetical protein
MPTRTTIDRETRLAIQPFHVLKYVTAEYTCIVRAFGAARAVATTACESVEYARSRDAHRSGTDGLIHAAR